MPKETTILPLRKLNEMMEFSAKSKSPKDSNQSTRLEEAEVLPARQPAMNKISDFFINHLMGWAKDFISGSPYPYPTNTTANTPIAISAADQSNEIIIGLAADWGTNTPQSLYVARQMAQRGKLPIEGLNTSNLDYTIHLGDTYYSGSESEILTCFGNGQNNNTGQWPRGINGSFALAGNHEMYSSGKSYFKMINTEGIRLGITGRLQQYPFFCIRTEHWCILGLDSGYQSVHHPFAFYPKKHIDFMQALKDWLKDVVQLDKEKRGIIVLTHHQYLSAFKTIGEPPGFPDMGISIQKALGDRPKEIIWIFGHEHRFAVYNSYQVANGVKAHCRCIGNGGMPNTIVAGKGNIDSNSNASKSLRLYDNRVADSIEKTGILVEEDKYADIGYNGYAILTLKDETAIIDYYECYQEDTTINHKISQCIKAGCIDEKVVTETWTADINADTLTQTNFQDLTTGNAPDNKMSYL